MKKRIIFGILISIFFLFLVLRNINFKDMMQIVANGEYLWMLPCLGTYTLSFIFRSIRWKYLLSPIRNFKAKQLFSSLIMGFAANCIFPFRFGEFVRAFIVGKKHNLSKSASLATIVLERIMDGVGILILLGVALLFLKKIPSWTKKTVIIAILLFIGSLVFAGVLIAKKHFIDWLKKIPLLKHELKEKIIDKIKKFLIGFEVIMNVKGFIMVIFFSLCVWICETFNLFFLIKITGIHLSYFTIIFVLFATVLGVTIPAAPGSIGTYEFFFVASLMFFGVAKEKAVASALITHSFGIIFVMVLGMFYFFKEGISYKEIAAAKK
ncbi:MAG: hypothetical protein A2539_02390 [Elusimicrobia bacterium RIFOXYD2_FULL_34_15]|nr:MAG: hypothetical protein A2539_02390 [Elusimicrobia bacterium RIFOXYD2_FULL_34_15]